MLYTTGCIRCDRPMRTCSIEGCERKHWAKNLCRSCYDKDYYQRPHVKARTRRYNQSDAGKAKYRRYSQSEKGKACKRRFRESGKAAEYDKKYQQRPEVKARRREYKQRPEVKARNRELRLRRILEGSPSKHDLSLTCSCCGKEYLARHHRKYCIECTTSGKAGIHYTKQCTTTTRLPEA